MKRSALSLLLPALVLAATAAACGSHSDDSTAAPGSCPTTPVPVVVTVDQWGDIVDQLGGDCANVTTVIKGSSADPHDYEPTPADAATFEQAKLVVLNGLNYDAWANKAIETLDEKPTVVDGGKVLGLEEGDNPHIWYSPDDVHKISAAVTTKLKKLAPNAAAYFDAQQAKWQTAMQPYDAEIAKLKGLAQGTTFAATEPVFDHMAEAIGMMSATPRGYQTAALNETDPSPADIAEFERSLTDGKINVVIYNAQTEGSTPERLRTVANDANVPVVEVTETLPPGTTSFVTWQLEQLKALTKALTP
jgi:zinc/manganese transport system substrate-binding protein